MENSQAVMQALSNHSVYMMGLSFVLGSLFTIFTLVILDLIRHSEKEEDEKIEKDLSSS